MMRNKTDRNDARGIGSVPSMRGTSKRRRCVRFFPTASLLMRVRTQQLSRRIFFGSTMFYAPEPNPSTGKKDVVGSH
jgi:hypothetical protein